MERNPRNNPNANRGKSVKRDDADIPPDPWLDNPEPTQQRATGSRTGNRATTSSADTEAGVSNPEQSQSSATPKPRAKTKSKSTGKTGAKRKAQPSPSQPSTTRTVQRRSQDDLAKEVKQTREYVRDSLGRFTAEAQAQAGATAATAVLVDADLLKQTLQRVENLIEQVEKQPKPAPVQKSSKTGKAKQRHSETTALLKALKLNTAWLAFQQDVGLMVGAATSILLLLGAQLLLTPQQSIVSQGINEALGTDFDEPVEKGETIGGYEVTSGFGPREAPTEGASSDHKGVDLGTPTGTKLYMIGSEGGTVECFEDDGGGTVATIKPKGTDLQFQAMHLNRCQSGEWAMGNVFAETGNSGISTGPHLHWAQLKDGEYVQPVKGWLIWAVTGSKPSAPSTTSDFELQAGDFGGTDLSEEQIGNAKAIISKGLEMGMSQNDIKIALMTVMVESNMVNVNYGDLDSLGLFQQRDSWGSDECRTDPTCSSELFFKALQQVGDRDSKAPGDVAQAVQKSAFPDRYANWETMADAVVSQAFGSAPAVVEVANRSVVPASATESAQPAPAQPAAASGSPLLQLKARLNAVINGGGVAASSTGVTATSTATTGNLSESVFRIGSATGWMGADGYGYTATHVTDITTSAQTQSGESCQISVDKQAQDVTRLKVEGACASLPGVPLGTHEDGEAMKAYGFPGKTGGNMFEAVGKSGGMSSDTMGRNSIEFIPDSLPGLQAGMSGGLCAGSDGAAIGVVSNGTDPEGQYKQGDKAWCAPLSLLTGG